jgi:hypothetical protein
MTNVLQDAAAWLAGQLKEKAGRTVTLTRGGVASGSITGWVSQKEYEVVGTDGILTSVTAFEWSFETSDLVISGSQVTPSDGYSITEVLNGRTIVYEVLPITGKPCSEWLDSSGVMTLVRTKRISVT